MIYDDRLVADFRSSKRVRTGAEYDRESVRLDALGEAAAATCDTCSPVCSMRSRRENVRLTEDNLELAKRRFEVGYSGRDEVFRWEAQLAAERATLLAIDGDVEASRIAFNQTLGIDQGKRWAPEEIVVDPAVFPFLDGRVDVLYRIRGCGRDDRLSRRVRAHELGPTCCR